MEEELKKECDQLRESIKQLGTQVLSLKVHGHFEARETYVGQHGEMIANIMLSFRHLEDARMRIGKVLQAADDGVSILDK